MRLRIAVCTLRIAFSKTATHFCVTPLKMPLPRAPINLARRGAWSAETTHAPRVPDVAVAVHRRAQPISKAFSREVTSARASKMVVKRQTCWTAFSMPVGRFLKESRAFRG